MHTLLNEIEELKNSNKFKEEQLKFIYDENQRIQEKLSISEQSKLSLDYCTKCENLTKTESTVGKHEDLEHEKIKMMQTLRNVESSVLEEKEQLKLSLMKLKEKELIDTYSCKCKSFCKIHHHRFNFRKSVCDQLILKYQTPYQLT